MGDGSLELNCNPTEYQGAMRTVSSKLEQNNTNANIKIQPPLLAMFHIAVAFVVTRLAPLPLSIPTILQAVGFPLVVLGFLLGIGALTAFRHARTTPHPRNSVIPLVTSGIYRFTRNPIYLGFLLMQVGLPLNARSYWGICLAPLMIFLFNRLVIEPEEEFLTHKFGDEYRLYKSKVRRWL